MVDACLGFSSAFCFPPREMRLIRVSLHRTVVSVISRRRAMPYSLSTMPLASLLSTPLWFVFCDIYFAELLRSREFTLMLPLPLGAPCGLLPSRPDGRNISFRLERHDIRDDSADTASEFRFEYRLRCRFNCCTRERLPMIRAFYPLSLLQAESDALRIQEISPEFPCARRRRFSARFSC